MPIKKRFNQTIEALKSGHRYLQPLEENEILEIKQHLKLNDPLLEKCLCILQNTSSYLPEIAPQVTQLIEQSVKSHQSDITIHLLNVSRRHVISAFQRDGQRLSQDFLKALKTALGSKDWEAIEWCVRTIDECGSQAIYFKPELMKIYPSKMAMVFNEHKRHTRGIIDLLLKKWSYMP